MSAGDDVSKLSKSRSLGQQAVRLQSETFDLLSIQRPEPVDEIHRKANQKDRIGLM